MENETHKDLYVSSSEGVLTPESEPLSNMIGQKIMDIGYYWQWWKKKTREEIKIWKKECCLEDKMYEFSETIAKCGFNRNIVIVLEKQHLVLFNLIANYPKIDFHHDLNLEKINEKLLEIYGKDSEEKVFFFSANQDPEMANDLVREMIGKKILGIDLIRVTHSEHYLYIYKEDCPDYRYCVLKLYLEGGIERLVGIHYTDLDYTFEIRKGNDILPERIDSIHPIRKEGYSID